MPRPRAGAVGELAPIVKTVIDMQAYEELYPPSLRPDALQLIHNPDRFTELFEHELPHDHRLHLSRYMHRHLPLLHDWDVVEASGHWGLVMKFFCVDKKDGSLRLVVDARRLNELQRRPPKMKIPRIHDVIDYILNSDTVWTCDARSYFYAFEINGAIRHYFQGRFAGARGDYHLVQLRRLAMGWSYAPYIAQEFSNSILQDPRTGEPQGLAWLDNFIFAGSREQVTQRGEAFLGRAKTINLALDEDTVQPKTKATILGLEFDTQAKQFRIEKSTIDKLPDIEGPMTGRSLLAVFGSLVWGSYGRKKPLHRHADAFDILRRLYIAGPPQLDDPFVLSEVEKDLLRPWIKDFQANEWQQWAPPQAPDEELWTDASDDATGYVWFDDEDIEAGRDAAERTTHIFYKEAQAIHRALLRILEKKGGDRTVQVFSDNKALVAAIEKGISSSRMVNHMMTEWEDAGLRVSAKWVPTEVELADALTRGISPQEFMQREMFRHDNFQRWREQTTEKDQAINNKKQSR